MGVGESSLLQSVDSLSAALGEIEQKLVTVEDTHTHNESTICHDGNVVVCGKRIKCRPGLELTVGPILGLITQTTCRILVETELATEMTFDVFLYDQYSAKGRHMQTVLFETSAEAPYAHTIRNLRPGCSYLVYVGGVRQEDTLSKYACFSTIPPAPENVRCAFTNKGRVDMCNAGESDLWQDLERRVIKSSRFEYRQHGVMSAPGIKERKAPVHMAIHTGDFLNVDATIRIRGLELLDLITKEGISKEVWSNMLDDIEHELIGIYRKALTNKTVALLLRRCGHLFIAGQLESAAYSASLFAVNRPQPQREEKEDEETAADPMSPGKKGEKGKEKEKKRPPPRKKKKKTEEEENAEKEVEEEEAQNNPPPPKPLKQRGEFDDYEPAIEDSAVPYAGATTRALREELLQNLVDRTSEQESTRTLMLGALLRIARRVYWAYFRQLWDEKYENIRTVDAENEVIHRTSMHLRKQLESAKTLEMKLERTRRKLVREFGEEYAAADKVTAHYRLAAKTIKEIESQLMELLVNNSTDNLDAPGGAVLNLGGTVIVLVEPAWNWLGADGALTPFLASRETAIHPAIYQDLERALAVLPRGSHGIDSSCITADGDYDPGLVDSKAHDDLTLTDPYSICVDYVICAVSSSMLPLHGDSTVLLPPEAPQPFVPSKLDVRRLLTCIAQWQQEDNARGALLASGSDVLAASGIVYPILASELPKEFAGKGNDTDDGWNLSRAGLHQIAVGGMTSRPILRSRHRTAHFTGKDYVARFRSENDLLSLQGVRSFFDVKTFRIGEEESVKRAAQVGQADDAFQLCGFNVECVLDEKPAVGISVGPVVGRVTVRSASILLETVETCHVEVVMTDQISGVEIQQTRRMVGGVPEIFVFNDLEPNRPYQVRLQNNGGNINGGAEDILDLTTHAALSSGVEALPTQAGGGDGAGMDKVARNDFINKLGLGQGIYKAPSALIATSTTTSVGESKRVPIAATTPTQLSNVPLETQVALQVVASFTTKCADATTQANYTQDNALSQSLRRAVPSDGKVEPVKSFTIIGIGANRPAWSRDLTSKSGEVALTGDRLQVMAVEDGAQSASRDDILGAAALDRACLEDGLAMVDCLTDILSIPYGGVDLVLHLGNNVDLASTLSDSITWLAQAEKRLEDKKANRMHMLNGQQDMTVEELMEQSKRLIRDAYRVHWGSSSMRAFLSQGSHMFISSPMVDLMRATNSGCLRHLARDLSSFVMNHLLQQVRDLESAYQSELFGPDGESRRAHYFHDGTICVFPLLPKIVYEQDELGGDFQNLIADADLKYLEDLLVNTGIGKPPKAPDVEQTKPVEVLVIASPLPLIQGDPDTLENLGRPSYVNNLGVRFSLDDLARLLALIAQWADGSTRRDCVIFTGGTGVNYKSVIESYVGNAPDKPAAKAVQMCCGPLVSVPDPTELGQKRNGSLSGNGKYTHRVVHSQASVKPMCAVLTVGNIHQATPVSIDCSGKALETLRNFHNDRRQDVLKSTPSFYQKLWADGLRFVDMKRDELMRTDVDVAALLGSTREACAEFDHIFSACHASFEKNVFGLTVRGGFAAQERVAKMVDWVLFNIPPSSRQLFLSPSMYVIGLVWADFRSKHGHPDAMAKYEHLDQGLLGAEVPSDADAITTVAILKDPAIFAALLRTCLEMAILFEHFSYTE